MLFVTKLSSRQSEVPIPIQPFFEFPLDNFGSTSNVLIDQFLDRIELILTSLVFVETPAIIDGFEKPAQVMHQFARTAVDLDQVKQEKE